MASSVRNDEVVSLQLVAPPGWQKLFLPKEGGRGTPKENEIVFTAPSGEEIINKKQLEQYLKAHPGGAKLSEFDWGSGETPRRSSRISEKVKSTPPPPPPPPETEPVKKRARKSSGSKKGKKEKDDVPEPITDIDVEMQEAEKQEENDSIALEEENDSIALEEENDKIALEETEGKERKEEEEANEENKHAEEEEEEEEEEERHVEKVNDACEIPKVPLSDKTTNKVNGEKLAAYHEANADNEGETHGAKETPVTKAKGQNGNFEDISNKKGDVVGASSCGKWWQSIRTLGEKTE